MSIEETAAVPRSPCSSSVTSKLSKPPRNLPTTCLTEKPMLECTRARAAQDFDAFYADRLREPEATDDLLVLSFDGKGIAMRHADLREATRKAAEAEPKLHTRLAKGEKPNRKRMAQVATVYSIARWQRTSADVLHGLGDDREAARPRPTNKRVWASAQRQRVLLKTWRGRGRG